MGRMLEQNENIIRHEVHNLYMPKIAQSLQGARSSSQPDEATKKFREQNNEIYREYKEKHVKEEHEEADGSDVRAGEESKSGTDSKRSSISPGKLERLKNLSINV